MREFPVQGLLPHHPHPAADGGADRRRRDLAAADRPRPRHHPLLSRTPGSASTCNIGRDAEPAFVTTVVMDIWHWTPLVTLTLLAALALAAEGAVRAGADRRRQPLPDLLAHHPADDPAGDPRHRLHPHDGRAAHRRRSLDADRRRPGRGDPLCRPLHLAGRLPEDRLRLRLGDVARRPLPHIVHVLAALRRRCVARRDQGKPTDARSRTAALDLAFWIAARAW